MGVKDEDEVGRRWSRSCRILVVFLGVDFSILDLSLFVSFFFQHVPYTQVRYILCPEERNKVVPTDRLGDKALARYP